MTDKAMKCAESENAQPDNPIRRAFRWLRDNYPNRCKVEGADCCEFDVRLENMPKILAQYASSSWVKIVEGKPETLPPIYREVLVSFNCGPQRFVRADAWDGMRWERSLADVLYWQPLPAAPEEQ